MPIPNASLVTQQKRRVSHGTGFWVIAIAFVVSMAFCTVPTPLYPLYQQRDGFATSMITVIFAAYAVGVMASLYLAGHISDWLGRRRVILASVLVEALSAALFLVWNDPAGLIVARFISGVGVGALTATATAHLSELRAVARPAENGERANIIATVVNTGGLALGPIIGGVLAQYVVGPLLVPYLVFLGLLILCAIGVAFVPETVERAEERPAYRPQRVSLPPDARGSFFAAAVGAAAAFSVFGVFTSLTATFVSGTLHVTSHVAAGSIVFGVMGAAAAAQILFGSTAPRRKLQIGVAMMAVGLLGIAAASLLLSIELFVVAGIASGAGVGLVFGSAIGVAASLAPAQRRGEVLAGMFLWAYAGLTVPVVAVGIALSYFGAQGVMIVFSFAVLVIVLGSGVAMLKRR
jgi:MFS family permease